MTVAVLSSSAHSIVVPTAEDLSHDHSGAVATNAIEIPIESLGLVETAGEKDVLKAEVKGYLARDVEGLRRECYRVMEVLATVLDRLEVAGPDTRFDDLKLGSDMVVLVAMFRRSQDELAAVEGVKLYSYEK